MFFTGRTPLFCAIEGENVDVVKYLLDHGADQDKADHEGLTPLHSAAETGPLLIYLCFAPLHHTVYSFSYFFCTISGGMTLFLCISMDL